MKYLFDTDTVTDLYDVAAVHHARLRSKVLSLADEDELWISILTHCELEYSYENAPAGVKGKIRKEIEAILRDLSVLPLRGNVARHYGELKGELKRIRSMSRANVKRHNIDLLLAATAIEESCILVSEDRVYKDLSRLSPELNIETW